jgi:hypothetical protein
MDNDLTERDKQIIGECLDVLRMVRLSPIGSFLLFVVISEENWQSLQLSIRMKKIAKI